MTEAVNCVLTWAEAKSEANSVIASTLKNNIAWFTVLEKNNFIKTCETETLFNWRINIK